MVELPWIRVISSGCVTIITNLNQLWRGLIVKVNDKHRQVGIKVAMNLTGILAYIFEVFCIAGLIWSAVEIILLDDLLDQFQVAARMFMLLAFVIISSYYTSRNYDPKFASAKESKKGGGV
jgi:Na+/H+-translocating membrane pyrophosphatase